MTARDKGAQVEAWDLNPDASGTLHTVLVKTAKRVTAKADELAADAEYRALEIATARVAAREDRSREQYRAVRGEEWFVHAEPEPTAGYWFKPEVRRLR